MHHGGGAAEADVQAARPGRGALPHGLLRWLQGVAGFSMASLPCHEPGEIWVSRERLRDVD